MDIYRQAQRTAGITFMLMKIIVPTVILTGITWLAINFLPISFTIPQAEQFVAIALSALTVVFLLIAPCAYFYAQNNTVLLRKTLTDFLRTLEDTLQEYEENIMDTRDAIRNLGKNRRKLLEDSWIHYPNTDVTACEIYVKSRISQLQEIVNSATIKDRITRQEYFLTLNKVINQLEDILESIPNLLKTKIPDDVFTLLCKETQEGFDTQMKAHENYICELKVQISILTEEIQEIKNILG